MKFVPKVSVVVPAYNAGAYLRVAVESLLAQTLREIEVLVVDDGSTDGSIDALGEVCDDRLGLIRMNVNRGVVAATNVGLEHAHACLIAVMDADDIAEPERLQVQASALADDPTLALVGSAAVLIDSAGHAFGTITPPLSHEAIRRSMFLRNAFIHSSVMYRSDLVRSLGGYSTRYPHAQDYELMLRIAAANRCRNLARPLVRYRVHAAQDSQRNLVHQRLSAQAVQRQIWAEASLAGLTEGCQHAPIPDALDQLVGAAGTVGGDYRDWASTYARMGDARASARAAWSGLGHAPLSPILWAMFARALARRFFPSLFGSGRIEV
jgi:glycosyltransferase involved in cell wall biosynthesis